MLPPRAYARLCSASSWEEIWEAGPYYERISKELEEARKFAVFVGWQIDSRLPLPGPHGLETLKHKILRICEERPDFQFYFLIWDHAYIYVLERELWQGRIWDEIHPRVHFVFDNRHRFGGSHHEKICLIDGETAFCGGIDLCDARWDSPFHFFSDPRRSLNHRRESHGPYHDLAVQVSGPIYREIHAHVARRWKKLTSIPFPQASRSRPQAGDSSVYLSRTLARIDGGKIMPTREIEFLFRDLIGSARKRIILEGQYYWSEELNDLLMTKMHEMRGKDFEVILILADLSRTTSLTRHMNSYELLLLEKLRKAAQFAGTRLILGYPYSFIKSVYVHSKVLVIDDRYISIGSANFAARAFRLDSEVTLTLEARTEDEHRHVTSFGEQILEHWGIRTHSRHMARHAGATLREINPGVLLDQIGEIYFKALAKRFFDPNVSRLYWIKTRFLRKGRKGKRLAKKPLPLLFLLFISTWLLWIGIAHVCGTPPTALALLASLLSLSWILPFPFLPGALLACLLSDPETGARLAVISAWIASFWGYTMVRTFPNKAARYYRRLLPIRPSKRLGSRRFAEAVSVLFDPKLSVQSKIAYPGLQYIPLPWFFLTNGLILPSMIYLSTLLASTLVSHALGHGLGRTLALAICGFWLAALTLDGLLKVKRWSTI